MRELIHAGDKLYFEDQPVWEDMADGRSVSRQFGGKLYIFDGKQAPVSYTHLDVYKRQGDSPVIQSGGPLGTGVKHMAGKDVRHA